MFDILVKFCYFFDLDGTLVNSSPCHSSAFHETLSIYHPQLSEKFNYEKVKGKATSTVFFDLGIKDPDEIQFLTKKKQMLYTEKVINKQVPLFPGAIGILKLLDSLNKKLYIVTSARKESAYMILEQYDLLHFFDDIVTSQDVKNNKPDPEIFLYALKISKVAADSVVVIEDSINGKIAAQNAGLDTVMVNQAPKVNNYLSFDSLEKLYLDISGKIKIKNA